MRKLLTILLAALCLGACTTPGTTTLTREFPAGAATPSGAELQQRLAGNSFLVNYAGGANARLQFKRDGHYFVNVSNNFSDEGTWRTEDGKVCTQSQKQGSNCFPVRVDADMLLLQRANGEIIRYEPR